MTHAQGAMISDAQITMLRLLSKDVAIAVDRAVKTRMQEQRISQGQLLLQTTRLLCSLQSHEQIVEAACECACELLHADSAVFIDCGSLADELYNPVEIGGPAERGQVFEAFVWQKSANDDQNNAATGNGCNDDSDDAINNDGADTSEDFSIENGDPAFRETSPTISHAAAASFIQSMFNRAPPPPASLREAWYNAHHPSIGRLPSHLTLGPAFVLPLPEVAARTLLLPPRHGPKTARKSPSYPDFSYLANTHLRRYCKPQFTRCLFLIFSRRIRSLPGGISISTAWRKQRDEG
jgi:hypothetical protein